MGRLGAGRMRKHRRNSSTFVRGLLPALRVRRVQPGVSWLVEGPESSFSQPGKSRQKRIGSCEKGSPPRSRRRYGQDRPLMLARRARFDRLYARPTTTIALCGIKFFFEKTLGTRGRWTIFDLIRPAREKKRRPQPRRQEDMVIELGSLQTDRPPDGGAPESPFCFGQAEISGNRISFRCCFGCLFWVLSLSRRDIWGIAHQFTGGLLSPIAWEVPKARLIVIFKIAT